MNNDLFIYAVLAFAVGMLSPFALSPYLKQIELMDVPNERSSHTRPTLRGGGLAQAFAVILALGAATFAVAGDDRSLILVILITCAAAATFGWLEDLKGLPVPVRACSQLLIGILASTIVALAMGQNVLWCLIGGVALLGGINVVNFMDGVNGISGLHGIVFGFSFVAIGILHNADWLTISGSVLGMAFAAFLPWNLSGRMFLGDVGSYLLGAATSILVTIGWMEGLPLVALVSPVLIYVADTAVTLLGRIYAGEVWHKPHRDHTYQRLNRMGIPHMGVALFVALLSSVTASAGIASAESSGLTRIAFLLVVIAVPLAYAVLRSFTRQSTKLGQPSQPALITSNTDLHGIRTNEESDS